MRIHAVSQLLDLFTCPFILGGNPLLKRNLFKLKVYLALLLVPLSVSTSFTRSKTLSGWQVIFWLAAEVRSWIRVLIWDFDSLTACQNSFDLSFYLLLLGHLGVSHSCLW